jgi:hypothetical protein
VLDIDEEFLDNFFFFFFGLSCVCGQGSASRLSAVRLFGGVQ